MTNNRITTKSPWIIRPAAIEPDKMTIIYSIPGEGREVLATETRADLELLRDALIQHLAPEKPAGPTHRAIFTLKTRDGAPGWAWSAVTLAGAPSLDTIAAMEYDVRGQYGAQSAILTNLIPLAGA